MANYKIKNRQLANIPLSFKGGLTGTEESPLDFNEIVDSGIYYIGGNHFINQPPYYELFEGGGAVLEHSVLVVYHTEPYGILQELTPMNHAAFEDRNNKKFYRKSLGSEFGWTVWRNIHDNINKNLLHNWDFRDPVNRNGKTEYIGANSISIDRWELAYNTNLTINDDNCTIKGSWGISQKLNQPISGTCTVSLLYESANFVSYPPSIILLNSNDEQLIASAVKNEWSGLVEVTFAHDDIAKVCIYSDGMDEFPDNSIDIIAVKLELGDQQTLAHQDSDGNWVLNEIPDYAEQMAICQQYSPTTGAYIGQSLPIDGSVAMRGFLDVKLGDDPIRTRVIDWEGNSHFRSEYITDELNKYAEIVLNPDAKSVLFNKVNTTDKVYESYKLYGTHNITTGTTALASGASLAPGAIYLQIEE